MALVKVGTLSQLPQNSVLEATVNGQRYAICNAGGEIHALSGTCPHRGGPVGQGAVNDGNVVCPWHAWEFDCSTGQNDYNPEIVLAKFGIELRGDDILMDVP